jgi:hypothetical protein
MFYALNTHILEITIQRGPGGQPDGAGRPGRDPVTTHPADPRRTANSEVPLTLLSGRWASSTTNFVLTFAGSVPFREVLSESQTRTQSFPGATSSGLSKVTMASPASDHWHHRSSLELLICLLTGPSLVDIPIDHRYSCTCSI